MGLWPEEADYPLMDMTDEEFFEHPIETYLLPPNSYKSCFNNKEELETHVIKQFEAIANVKDVLGCDTENEHNIFGGP